MGVVRRFPSASTVVPVASCAPGGITTGIENLPRESAIAGPYERPATVTVVRTPGSDLPGSSTAAARGTTAYPTARGVGQSGQRGRTARRTATSGTRVSTGSYLPRNRPGPAATRSRMRPDDTVSSGGAACAAGSPSGPTARRSTAADASRPLTSAGGHTATSTIPGGGSTRAMASAPPDRSFTRVAPGAHVGPLAVIGEHCTVAAGARIARSILWERVEVGAGATLSDCVVGANVVIGAGAEIGRGVVVESGAVVPPRPRLPE